jgi:hypothetical protein
VPPPPTSRCRVFAEIALIFAVFCIQGAWPAPDVNEPYYLGKAIHFWNPTWLCGDFFMESADTHKVFYFTFGWMSLWLSPIALVWTGRISIWLLLAWAWRRLSAAVVPRPWYCVLTAALFACLMDRCHMAGEWVIGGVEAKGFAYVFVFLGLESLVRNRWNRALLLFGAASAFHVLVGGWAAVATGMAWLWLIKPRPVVAPHDAILAPPLRCLWPGILGGLTLALPGLVPSLTIDWGVESEITRQAHQIYVFERLPHHLVLAGMRPEFIVRLALLWVFWLLLLWASPSDETRRRLRAFVAGAVVITLIGAALQSLIYVDRVLAANLLRYYWFRLTDVALPLGVALESAALVAGLAGRSAANASPLQWGGFSKWQEFLGNLLHSRRVWLSLAILIAAFHLGDRTLDRIASAPPRSNKMADFEAWRNACEWVADSGEIPPDARFLTPRLAQTFAWYAGRSDVVTWKDVPQDARKIVQWWDRIQDIYATGQQPPEPRWHESLAELGAERLRQLGAKYHADYAIAELSDPPLELPAVYRNQTYVIYRLR